MTTWVFRFGTDSVPMQLLDLRDPLAWLLLFFGGSIAVSLLWLVFRSAQRERSLRRVPCPVRMETAELVLRRDWRGRVVDVSRCSLLQPPQRLSCQRECLHLVVN